MKIDNELAALSLEQRRLVYSRFCLELTIGARAVWSDPEYSDIEKLNALKWLNEIQHRTWHAFMDSPSYSPPEFVSKVLGHIQQAEIIRGHVGACYRLAYDYVVGR